MIIIIIICKALNSRTSSDQKPSAEKNSTGFEFGVFLPPGRCLTRLMRPPPQNFEIRVYHLLDSCLTRLMRLSPQDETTTIGKIRNKRWKHTKEPKKEENRKTN